MSRAPISEMATSVNAQACNPKLLGLFELDADGKVLYSSFQKEDGSMAGQDGLNGSDFFKQVAQFSNVGELHDRFLRFRLADVRSSSFEFTCEYPEGLQKVRVVMARLLTNAAPDTFLVHFKKF